MKNCIYKTLAFTLLAFNWLNVSAVPASPYPVSINQPDGTTLTVYLRGDEFHHYQTTEDGVVILKNKNGVYNYARVDATGKISDTSIKAKNVKDRNDSEKLLVSEFGNSTMLNKVSSQMRTKKVSVSKKVVRSSVYPNTGSPKSLVILVNFSDVPFVTPSPQSAFSKLLNEPGYSANGGTGSARDYFKDNSMGTFSPDFVVVGPYTLPNTLDYYGKNDTDGYDQNAIQMIVDACKLANENGLDFTQFDTDNDNLVDNVFVYYSGYNEAENAPDNTVWPHRWGIYPNSVYGNGNYTGSTASVTFDGKRVEDYACTSELQGKANANMCGIGTFTHEFGHVLGLADMYATDGGTHHTLDYWDIMDYGPYLNSGRTPPSYSAFERFSLGYLTPVEIRAPQNLTLDPLNTHNQAYLISTAGTKFNMDPTNSTEYFLLENRQKTGWDKFLPGHGMLITRVKYDLNKWANNEPNNTASSMGVDIMEADGLANRNTLSGDPFPGSSMIDKYTPKLISGVLLTNKPLTDIKESNGVISFKFMGGGNVPVMKSQGATTEFSTVQGTPTRFQTLTIEGKNLGTAINIAFTLGTHFEIKKETDPETAWGKNITLLPIDSVVSPTNIQIRYNPTEPSYLSTHYDNLQFTTPFAEKLSIPLSGKSSRPVYVVPPVAASAADVTYRSFVASWNSVNDATGYYLTVYNVSDEGITDTIVSRKWITATSDTLYNLVSNRNYYYKVQASDKNTLYGYENITNYSNTVKVRSASYPLKKELRVVYSNGSVRVFVPSRTSVVNVFNMIGQKIMSFTANSDIPEISNLQKGQVYIIQADEYRAKVLVH